MASLRDYFFTEFNTLLTHFDYSLKQTDGGPDVTVIARVHSDPVSYTRYVSYFISEGQYTIKIAAWLSQNPTLVLDKADSSVKVTLGHPAVYGALSDISTLHFSGRVFLYIDETIPEIDKEGLIAAAAGSNIYLEIKDKGYSNFMTINEKPWAFISHDSRDKEGYSGRPVEV